MIEAASIPISDDARRCDDPLRAALDDGEDFELLFTLARPQSEQLIQTWDGSVAVTPIGHLTEAEGMWLRKGDGQLVELRPGGYDHLANEG